MLSTKICCLVQKMCLFKQMKEINHMSHVVLHKHKKNQTDYIIIRRGEIRL